ncbi:MAG: methylmalonyl Co-A mutase-associated GTPase MeaB [Bacteroidetes bacterium]|nr:methylmalonyl Co-A mutase-associated GTPase MeaB [Bacteroidota bacterium]
MSRLLDANYYAQGVLNQDIPVLARAITLVESNKPAHQQLAAQILEQILPYSSTSIRLGITGVPGVGKSTFIECFGHIALQKNHKIAVLAIDPSSTLSKGSILGDKTRMEKLTTAPHVFIRPSPSGGNLGGVAHKTRETILLCEAAGFDYIIIETVGVGQSETEVHQLSDFFLLLMLAGAGDELQGIKRGIMEMADGLAITKADGANTQKAKNARAEYARALHLFPPAESGWIPEAKVCSSTENTGIAEVYDMIEKYVRHAKSNGFFEKKRKQQTVFWFERLVQEKIQTSFFSNMLFLEKYQQIKEQLQNEKLSVTHAIQMLFAAM